MSDSAFVIGCGSIGERHSENLTTLGVDVSVFDIDAETRNAVRSDVGVKTKESVEAGLEADPDMVFVCTPSNAHIQPAQKAAAAGCDLFVEKPLSNTAEGIKNLLYMIGKNNIVSMIGCNYRFHPAMQTVKRLLDSDAVGNVVSGYIEMGSYLPDWHPWEDYREMYSAREGVGGALLDMIHGINYGRWFFGEAELVTGMLGQQSNLEIATEDTVDLIVRYKNGVQCEYHFDYVQRTPSRSGRIVGENGTIRWDGIEKSVRRYDVAEEEWVVECTYDECDLNQMYVDMTEHFLECVEERTETTSPVTEGRKDLRLALAAKESFKSGEHVEI